MSNSNNQHNKSSSFRLDRSTSIDPFRLTLFVLASMGVALLLYISYINTLLYHDELVLFTPIKTPKKTILGLESPQTEYQVGEVVNVMVLMETELKRTQGVDVLLKYNPDALALLTVENQREDFSDEPSEVRLDPLEYLNIQNSPFNIFPYFSINGKAGLIIFSALAKPLQQIGGNVEVATLNFQVLQAGEVSLDFVFEKGKTDDTNVAFYGKDILERVKNLALIVE